MKTLVNSGGAGFPRLATSRPLGNIGFPVSFLAVC